MVEDVVQSVILPVAAVQVADLVRLGVVVVAGAVGPEHRPSVSDGDVLDARIAGRDILRRCLARLVEAEPAGFPMMGKLGECRARAGRVVAVVAAGPGAVSSSTRNPSPTSPSDPAVVEELDLRGAQRQPERCRAEAALRYIVALVRRKGTLTRASIGDSHALQLWSSKLRSFVKEHLQATARYPFCAFRTSAAA